MCRGGAGRALGIEWQGKSGEITSGATTILKAFQGAAGNNTRVTYTRDGSAAQGASVGVLVLGEKPYAEMMGDRTDLDLDVEDLQAV